MAGEQEAQSVCHICVIRIEIELNSLHTTQCTELALMAEPVVLRI